VVTKTISVALLFIEVWDWQGWSANSGGIILWNSIEETGLMSRNNRSSLYHMYRVLYRFCDNLIHSFSHHFSNNHC